MASSVGEEITLIKSPGRALASQPDPEGPDDSELVRELGEGRVEVLSELYLRHGATVRNILMRYAGNLSADEVDDLGQEVFLAAVKAAKSFRGKGTPRAWLCGIAIRLARGYRRKHAVRRALLGRFGSKHTALAAETEGSPDELVGSKRAVKRAVENLPRPLRETLLLHVVEELSAEEIAQALGVKPNTVWTRLHRARAQMRKTLQGKEDVA